MLLSTTAWVSVLSVGDSMHEVRRQRMHGHQFAAQFLVGRGRRCWKHAVKSVMECWWPAWAGWWCSPAPDQSGHCARGDTISFDSLHDRKPTQIPKGGSYMVAWFQVEHESRRRVQDYLQWCQCGRRGRRCSSRGATALGDSTRAETSCVETSLTMTLTMNEHWYFATFIAYTHITSSSFVLARILTEFRPMRTVLWQDCVSVTTIAVALFSLPHSLSFLSDNPRLCGGWG